MPKGITVNLKSYQETIPKVLKLIKLENELKKYDKIVLKVALNEPARSTSPDFVEPILQFCLNNKNPVAEVFIADGADGANTLDLFDQQGYRKLSDKYSIGLIDLNEVETETIQDNRFQRFQEIKFPKILKDSFLISLTSLNEDAETSITGSIPNMLGAFPAQHYSGFFSSKKNKIRKWPIKYSIYDIIQCKMPDLAVIDASAKGKLIFGKPIEADKQAASLLGKEIKEVSYLKLLDEMPEKKANETKTAG